MGRPRMGAIFFYSVAEGWNAKKREISVFGDPLYRLRSEGWLRSGRKKDK